MYKKSNSDPAVRLVVDCFCCHLSGCTSLPTTARKEFVVVDGFLKSMGRSHFFGEDQQPKVGWILVKK